MSLTSLIALAAEEPHRELAISPNGIGAITLGIFLILIVALLIMGGGREHS